ncbi:MAG: pyruvate:ferredoxin (flavodoxin) oxidoreductase [Deltaproteobacteria bacterium]|nr:pyruvate:ferredoxin (flavodoxin) oxidoreductase [Deltaproteobacteria bacterium]
MQAKKVTIDGNEAAAHVAYRVSEVIAIYPITPSSNMGEWADAWAADGQKNVWGTVPAVVEMQSEGGAAGAIHGAVTTGALCATFTASQGLLLMIPNMFKIAGELTPCCLHVSARAVATHALSIFGDHSDVMATRGTGFALLASNSVQEAMDMALVAHAATLESRVPFLHFFDGFRTSHEVLKIDSLDDDVIRKMINMDAVSAHRARALSPDHPTIKGTAQNPDVFFQARETVNPWYQKGPAAVQATMDKLGELCGRHYRLFEYVGAADAERVIVMMGSGAEAAHEAVDYLTKKGEKVGLVKVRLYRPFSVADFVHALPKSVKSIAVLDRTKEPGALGEPLYLDVVTALNESLAAGAGPFKQMPRVVGGRYGLASKEFRPAMVKGVFDELKADKPKNHFVVGIVDDVTRNDIAEDLHFDAESPKVFRGLFYGLGSDGTVGANKNSIKIIGEETDNHAQGYFVYDSKKAGTITVSHLRFGPDPIRSTYLVNRANFIACHQWTFLERYDMLEPAVKGAVFLLNSPYAKDEIWDQLPIEVQQQIIDKDIKLWTIDAPVVAQKTGMGRRINTIMQTCFFAISNILPKDEAIQRIKDAAKKTYGARGDEVVKKNWAAIDLTLAHLHQVKVPAKATSTVKRPPVVAKEAPEFVQKVTAEIIKGKGDKLPVSVFPADGTFPLATTQWEKRNIALEIPVWDPEICIQCGKCVLVCPHASIRQKVFEPALLKNAPPTFKAVDFKGKEYDGWKYTLQTAPEDCTGCGLCVDYCPVKSKTEARLKAINMTPQLPLRETERKNYAFFLGLPEADRKTAKVDTIKGSQFLQPLFEYSGACEGCGETPYVKLVSQLFGDRALVANATGCSSIYGANLPTTPWAVNKDGRGPAWSNSLFEDNAEFGLGFRLTCDKFKEQAEELVRKLEAKVGGELVKSLVGATQKSEADIYEQRQRVEALKGKLKGDKSPEAQLLLPIADYLVKKSVWIIGGDGWAYDIGYGGLDHVIASGRDVNLLVLDTEVYSNTGGQMSKATPRGAVAKFAAAGKPLAKKDLALLAMSYGSVYVARVAMGANDAHTIKSFLEAEAFPGPSIIIAYSHCIAHGINMTNGMQQQKAAVTSGYWPLMRYNPELQGTEAPMKLDSKPPKGPLSEYVYNETRYKMLTKADPERAKMLLDQAQEDVNARFKMYEQLQTLSFTGKR